MRKTALIIVILILFISIVVGLDRLEKPRENALNNEKTTNQTITLNQTTTIYENVGNTTKYNCEKLKMTHHNKTHCTYQK